MSDRLVFLDDNLPGIPEDLMLARDRGLVLFIAGAGISRASPSNLPDFRGLVVQLYVSLNDAVGDKLKSIDEFLKKRSPRSRARPVDWTDFAGGLNPEQQAELKRFVDGDYDVVLGMLERRLVAKSGTDNGMRRKVIELLQKTQKHNALHSALATLGRRFEQPFIATTNFDLLLEKAYRRRTVSFPVHVLGSIPRPSRKAGFVGVFHIHGALPERLRQSTELVLTDQDFGDAYLRRRIVTDFIYDAARIFHIVLVGYSVGDAPMRYLLNAIAGDESHYPDIKGRYSFVPTNPKDAQRIEADWKNRGIKPLVYDDADNHATLLRLLGKWADVLSSPGERARENARVDKITRRPYSSSSQSEQSVFQYLVRRARKSERQKIVARLAESKRHFSWLDQVVEITRAELDFQE